MRLKIILAFALAFCLLFSATGSFGAQNKTLQTPIAFLPENQYAFAPVLEGAEVLHDFILQNIGTVPLKVKKVRTGWGCTAVSYTRQIPPGGEGKISIKVYTIGYGGKRLNKNITVETNDQKNPNLTLTVFGMVEKFVTIIPKNVILRGFVGDQIKTTVKIILEEKYPFKIIESKAIDGKNIRFKLEENKLSKKMEYILTVENLKKDKGRYYDNISLKTDNNIRPLIRIRVNGSIRDRQPGANK